MENLPEWFKGKDCQYIVFTFPERQAGGGIWDWLASCRTLEIARRAIQQDFGKGALLRTGDEYHLINFSTGEIEIYFPSEDGKSLITEAIKA